jgi:Bacterial RNA polymerase, alpha chain C terminal domain
MLRLREAFPFLSSVPATAAEVGLSVEAELESLTPDARCSLIPAVAASLREHPERELGILLPGLQARSNHLLHAFSFTNRSKNALARAGVRTWSDLAKLTPADVRTIPNVGALTVDDILQRCVEWVLSTSQSVVIPAMADDSDGTLLDLRAEVGAEAVHILEVIAAWAVSERGTRRVGDIYGLVHDPGTLPPDLRESWAAFANLDLRSLASASLSSVTLDDLAKELLKDLGPSYRLIYERRILANPPSTLEKVGLELGVTRERVRQIQMKVQELVSNWLRSDRFRLLRWRAADLRLTLGSAAPIDSEEAVHALERCLRDASSQTREFLRLLVLQLAGPYRRQDDWLVLDSGSLLDPGELIGKADEFGLLPLSEAREWLSTQDIRPAFHDAWLERSGRFRVFGETLAVWSNNIVAKCIAVLALRGEPTSADTLVELIGEGHNVRGVRARLFDNPYLMRTSRTQWALRAWGLEEYTGITDEIAQRIEEAGGRARLDTIISELVRQFGVREASVRVYAEAPMFIMEDGWVRLRREDEPFEAHGQLTDCRGVFRSANAVLSVLIDVDSEVLRGSGQLLPGLVAAALGVLPERPRIYRQGDIELSVTWPRTAALGASLGSTRALAAAAGATEGDRLRLDFHTEVGHVRAERVPADTGGIGGAEMLRLLTGITPGRDPLAQVAAAIEVTPGDIRRILVARGDAAVADLLPSPEVDSCLESALSDLAEILGELR